MDNGDGDDDFDEEFDEQSPSDDGDDSLEVSTLDDEDDLDDLDDLGEDDVVCGPRAQSSDADPWVDRPVGRAPDTATSPWLDQTVGGAPESAPATSSWTAPAVGPAAAAVGPAGAPAPDFGASTMSPLPGFESAAAAPYGPAVPDDVAPTFATEAPAAPRVEVVATDASGAPTHVRYDDPIETHSTTPVTMGGNQTGYTPQYDSTHVRWDNPPPAASSEFYGIQVGGQVHAPSPTDYPTPGSAAAAGAGVGPVRAGDPVLDHLTRTITGTAPIRDASGVATGYTTTSGSSYRDLTDALDREAQDRAGVKNPYAGPTINP